MVADDSNDDRTKSFVALTAGAEVSHYKIISKIGAGGMGEVYLAEDTKLKRQVALKFLPQHLCQDEACRKRFTREAQAAAGLDHPNIVPVYEVGEFKGRPFFAMAHIEGQSLREVIKQGKLTVNEVVDLTMQVCEGLYEAHSAGVVHRDIKPGNIIIDKKGKPRLLDFGLATVSGEEKLTKTGSTLGTVGYMSPEQIDGKNVDHRSDLFSVGVILYEMITGRRPFAGDNDAAVVKAISSSTPEPIARFKSGVTGELQSIIDKALSKDVSIRYQHADGMLADLRRLAVSERVTVPAKKKARRLWWAAAISLLIIVAAWGGLQFKHWLAPTEAQVKSLAVVDFDNIGAEEDAYLASGLAEDLAVKLRRLEGFHVASSADIRRLAKENLLPREVAARLKVQYALGGSLLREDTLVRVNVELIEKETGDVVWSDQIDKQFTEIFQFMDEVSQKIAQALEVRLTPVDKATMAAKPTDNAEAYDHYLKGRHYYYRVTFRDNELAEREFERALQLDPDYPLALAGLADAYVQRYKERFDYDEYWLDSSKVLIDRALTLDPNLAEAYESRAEVFLQEDNITGALEAAKKARDLRPDWDEPFIHLANIYKDRGVRFKAMALYDTALSLRPSVDALCGKGNIYMTRGQIDSAKATYQAAADLNPNHDRPWVELADLYEQMNNEPEMEKYERRAIEARPDQAFNYSLLSATLYYQGKVKEAENLLRGYVDAYPYSWEGYYRLFNYFWAIGDYPAAFAVVEEAVRRNPDRVWPYLLLAYSYLEKMSPEGESDHTDHEFEMAVAAIERALELRPNSGRVLQWAGGLYISLRRMGKAMEYYDRALEVRPGSSELLYGIASQLRAIREYERSVEYGLRAVELSPGNSDYFPSFLKRNLLRLNRGQEWLEIVENAAAIYGDDPFFLMAASAEKRASGDYETSIALTDSALKAKSQQPWLLSFAITLWMSGETERAIEKFKAASNEWISAHGVVAVLKSESRFAEIDEYLESIKVYTSGHKSGLEQWAGVAGNYYMSMRRFDDALAVYSEFRESGQETWSGFNSLLMAECLRQQGAIGRAKELLQELGNTPMRHYWPFALVDLAKLNAIETQDFASSIELTIQAQAEYIVPNDWATQPMLLSQLLFQFAHGKMADVEKSLSQLQSYTGHPSISYRKAQLAAATNSDSAGSFLDNSVSELARMSHGENIYGAGVIVIGQACSYCALALARAGKSDDARREIKRAIKYEPEWEDIAYHAACAYALIGDTDLALQWLETAVERGHQELWWAHVDPDLDPLRELPRFKEIMNDWDGRIQALLEKSRRN